MNARSELLLYTLCACVRVLTLGHAMRLLRFGDRANFMRFVEPLVASDLVRSLRVFAKPVPESMTRPLLAVAGGRVVGGCAAGVGGETPSKAKACLGTVLDLAYRRWADLPATGVACYVATRRSGLLYGVRRTGSLPRPLQATHDTAVGAVFCHHILDLAVPAEWWLGEDFEAGLDGRKPDALLRDPAGAHPGKVIEVVGADYTAEKLLAIHRECEARGLAYELW